MKDSLLGVRLAVNVAPQWPVDATCSGAFLRSSRTIGGSTAASLGSGMARADATNPVAMPVAMASVATAAPGRAPRPHAKALGIGRFA